MSKRGEQDTESAKAKEERDEEGGERELGPGKDAEFRESQGNNALARDEETSTHSAGCTGKESRERKNARHRGDMDVRWRAKSRRHALGAGCKRAWWQRA